MHSSLRLESIKSFKLQNYECISQVEFEIEIIVTYITFLYYIKPIRYFSF